MVLNPHDVQDRHDNPQAVTLGLGRRHARFLAQKPHHHADRILPFHGDPGEGIHRVEKAGVLDEKEGPLIGTVKAAADRDAFVFFAHLKDPEVRVAQDGLEQVLARHAVRQRHHNANASALHFPHDLIGL